MDIKCVEMIDPDKLEFTKLDRKGLDILIEWAGAEGWNPGPYDADVFWETDPHGFYGYFHQGKLIAGGSVISYDGTFGFMGFFIVKPQLRSHGIGRRLWKQRRDLLLSRLKPGAPIGMDGVVAMQAFYNKGGFEIAFRDERYARKGEKFELHPNVSLFEDQDLMSILEFDKQCFGYIRPQFMKPWLRMPQSKVFKYTIHERLVGFCVLRKATTGYKIGPLFADDEKIAEALYKACLNAAPYEEIYLDIPVNNTAAQALVKKYKASYVFECARMYYGTRPKLPVDKIFGITTFELG